MVYVLWGLFSSFLCGVCRVYCLCSVGRCGCVGVRCFGCCLVCCVGVLRCLSIVDFF